MKSENEYDTSKVKNTPAELEKNIHQEYAKLTQAYRTSLALEANAKKTPRAESVLSQIDGFKLDLQNTSVSLAHAEDEFDQLTYMHAQCGPEYNVTEDPDGGQGTDDTSEAAQSRPRRYGNARASRASGLTYSVGLGQATNHMVGQDTQNPDLESVHSDNMAQQAEDADSDGEGA